MVLNFINHINFRVNQYNSDRIMLETILAFIPGMLTLMFFFGYGIIIQLMLSFFTALISEGVIFKLRNKKFFNKINNKSSLITCLLLTCSLPFLNQWWIIVLSTIFTIVVSKQLYGGFGNNIFNPAMIGYAIVLVFLPIQIYNNWLIQQVLTINSISFLDTVSLIFTNSKLEYLKVVKLCKLDNNFTNIFNLFNAFSARIFKIYDKEKSIFDFFIKIKGIFQWICINIGFLIGGLYLINRKIISWHIPISIFFTLIIYIIFKYCTLTTTSFISVLIDMLHTPIMLGVFFIATDPITSPITIKGKTIFGIIIGLLTCIIDNWNTYFISMNFSVLLSNICVPIIDRYTQIRNP